MSNVLSAFIDETLLSAGVSSQSTIDLAGAGFQAAIVIGGIVLGGRAHGSNRRPPNALCPFLDRGLSRRRVRV